MPLTDNLELYLTFDHASGNATDSSGNSRDFTNNNSTAYASAKLGNGADLERSSSNYFSRANNFNFTAGTINCWLKRESVGADHRIITFNTGAGAGGLGFSITTADKLQGYMGNATNNIIGGTSLNSTAVFYMATYTWNTSRKELFLNAVTDGANETDETLTAGEANVSIGRDQRLAVDYFDGIIDEFGIWSRVLTNAEITELYNGGTGVNPLLRTSTSETSTLTEGYSFGTSIVINDTLTLSENQSYDLLRTRVTAESRNPTTVRVINK